MAQNLAAVFSITDKYTATMKAIALSQDTFEKKTMLCDRAQEDLNKELSRMKTTTTAGAVGIGTLTNKMAGLVSVAYLAKKALDGTFAGINISAMQKIQETTFQALLNSKEAGSNLYKYVGAYAKISALGREDIAKGVTTFLTVTRDINQVEQLIKMTERLYAKDPTQGAEGAVFALKEALSGDVISLRNRYGITGLSGEGLRAGDTTSKIEQINQALNAFGATQEVVDSNYGNLITQTNIFTSNMKTAIGESATPVMNNLAEVMIRLNENMEAGKYQPFISLMVNGMSAIGHGLAFVADNANWLIPTIGAVTASLLVYNTATKLASKYTVVLGAIQAAATGDWIKLGSIVLATTAAIGVATLAMNKFENQLGTSNLADIKNNAGNTLAGTKLPVEITNTDPVKVTGEVEIEKENLKYWLDMAGKKFFAEFNANTIAPQVIMQGTQVYETTDLNKVGDYLGQMIYDNAQIQPQGV